MNIKDQVKDRDSKKTVDLLLNSTVSFWNKFRCLKGEQLVQNFFKDSPHSHRLYFGHNRKVTNLYLFIGSTAT